jgi:hypothetical protein
MSDKPQLTKEDWAEIYYALDSKIASAVVGGDKGWKGHLANIMETIGPDGCNMVDEEEEPAKPRVIFCISGGSFSGAFANMPINYSVLDYDNKNACDQDGFDPDGSEEYARLEEEIESLMAIEEGDDAKI